jgi:hypothetical protein
LISVPSCSVVSKICLPGLSKRIIEFSSLFDQAGLSFIFSIKIGKLKVKKDELSGLLSPGGKEEIFNVSFYMFMFYPVLNN